MDYWKIIKDTNWAQDPDVLRVAKFLRGSLTFEQFNNLEEFVNIHVETLRSELCKREHKGVLNQAVMSLLHEDESDQGSQLEQEEMLEHIIWDISLDVVGHGQAVFDAVIRMPILLSRWNTASAFGAVFLALEDLEEEEKLDLFPSLNYSSLN